MQSRLTDLVFLFVTFLVAISPRAAHAQSCVGDCNGDSLVTIDELVQGVKIALGTISATNCVALDRNGDEVVVVDELVTAVVAALGGCPLSRSLTPTHTPAVSPTPTPSPDPQRPPASEMELTAWLQKGLYKQWVAESQIHDSLGPHFGRVRTFVNDAIFASLQQGLPAHPAGSAVVKELYGRGSGERIGGWSVMIKLQANSAGGDGWYWYENFGGIFAAEVGAPGCTGCHSTDYRGLTNRDFLLTPFPLQ